ncbi:hypothetical protein MAPG_05281 [Magnaporthiopsis poae ATCC 64411]|uniref:Uncharacterized protein n=1 Tax=Magnaporthiopsis poae (strain ATCC 64411 / 73-15) TaxID=644358 RepID=A0A0C4DYZ6_MAGP6|nr:hypothetical protein MAPG_05281 [Magnaporthiopsis poae ATCC 64411]
MKAMQHAFFEIFPTRLARAEIEVSPPSARARGKVDLTAGAGLSTLALPFAGPSSTASKSPCFAAQICWLPDSGEGFEADPGCTASSSWLPQVTQGSSGCSVALFVTALPEVGRLRGVWAPQRYFCDFSGAFLEFTSELSAQSAPANWPAGCQPPSWWGGQGWRTGRGRHARGLGRCGGCGPTPASVCGPAGVGELGALFVALAIASVWLLRSVKESTTGKVEATTEEVPEK